MKKIHLRRLLVAVGALSLLVFVGMGAWFFGFSPELFGASIVTTRSDRVALTRVDLENKNFVITSPDGDSYLIHYKKGCTGLTVNTKTILMATRGKLDAVSDLFKLGEYDVCDIDQAVRVSALLTVGSVYPSETESILMAEDGKRYAVNHPNTCRAIRSFLRQKIYADLGDQEIQGGDKLYFPRNAGVCTIKFAKPIEGSSRTDKDSEKKEYVRPGPILNLKATPTDRGVELYWTRSPLEENVSYTLVSTSRSPIDPRKYELGDMPNQERATANFYTVKGLDNGKEYYFYVIPVDKNGRAASVWSSGVKAVPTGAAFRPTISAPTVLKLNLRLAKEDARSFVFQWDLPSSATLYTVSMQVNGKHEFAQQNQKQSSVIIYKKAEYKGKSLRLKVSASNRYGLVEEGYYNFNF